MSKSARELLSEGGLFSSLIAGFEAREQQVTMADMVTEALHDQGVALIEAATGTGKTLAYLVPAALSGKTTIVSTATKTLQHQLFDKDVPLLKQVFPDLKAVLLKGRNNYLCKLLLEEAEEADGKPAGISMTPDERRHWHAIRTWAVKTKSGDRAELRGIPDESRVWSQLTSSAEHCLGRACEHYESCYLVRAREEAARADLVITNHHLFFADAAIRDRMDVALLPKAEAIVFDEAHHLEETAANFFTVRVSNRRLSLLAGDIDREAEKSLPAEHRDSLNEVLAGLTEAQELFFTLLAETIAQALGREEASSAGRRRGGASRGNFEEQKVRVDSFMEEEIARLATALKDLRIALENVDLAIGQVPFGEVGQQLRDRCDLVSNELETLLVPKSDDFVHLAFIAGSYCALEAVPLDMRPVFRQHVFRKGRTTILTSATLSTDNNFRFLRARLGVHESAQELLLEPVFDYMQQSILFVPDDLPDPRSSEFAAKVATTVEELVTLTEGRAFVLFTSYRNMHDVYRILEKRLPFPLLRQGDSSREELLERFRDEAESVLFATASFWEGVDVPGESLSLVIIDKLPFPNPSDPIHEARERNIVSRGGNGFRDISVPSAVISLKQGFGRLIRRKDDYGIVAILDQRLINKGYGKRFLKSLPRARRTQSREMVRRWWAHKQGEGKA